MLVEDNHLDFQIWKEGKLARVEFLDTPFNIYQRRQRYRLSRHLEYKSKENQTPRLRKLIYDRLRKACCRTYCQNRDERRTPPPYPPP